MSLGSTPLMGGSRTAQQTLSCVRCWHEEVLSHQEPWSRDGTSELSPVEPRSQVWQPLCWLVTGCRMTLERTWPWGRPSFLLQRGDSWGCPKAVGKRVLFLKRESEWPITLSTKGCPLEAPTDLKEGFTWSSEREVCSWYHKLPFEQQMPTPFLPCFQNLDFTYHQEGQALACLSWWSHSPYLWWVDLVKDTILAGETWGEVWCGLQKNLSS